MTGNQFQSPILNEAATNDRVITWSSALERRVVPVMTPGLCVQTSLITVVSFALITLIGFTNLPKKC